MKEKMCRVQVFGSKRERKAILEDLQRSMVMDISEPEEDIESQGFFVMNTKAEQTEFSQKAQTGQTALEILKNVSHEKAGMFASLEGRRTLTVSEYYKYVDKIPTTLSAAEEIIKFSDEIAEKEVKKVKYLSETDELSPWLEADVPLEGYESRTTAGFLGMFGEKISGDEILSKYSAFEDVPTMEIEIIKQEAAATYVFCVCPKKSRDACEKALRKVGFSRPKTQIKGVPKEETEKRQKAIAEIDNEIKELKDKIASYKSIRQDIEFLVDYFAMREEKYDVLSRLAQRKNVFLIEGYIPEYRVDDFKAKTEHKYSAVVEVEPADEDAPVLLKNSRFSEPVESVVETFSLPGRHEIDPTTIMSVFYYIFFGLMLSDAAYGLIMFLGCAIVLKKFGNMEDSMKKTLRMFRNCGISTMFWGVMFGSYFGDAISVVSSTFFAHEINIPPVWFEPVKDPMKMLMFSFLLGIIHLFTALGIKIYQCIKVKDYRSMWTDGIFWFMLVGGIVVYLFRVDMFLEMAGIDGKIPQPLGVAAAATAIIGALGIIVFTSQSKNVGKRLAKGAYALYGVTSWLSDILSYSRLLALGLATGVIATVFNKMGSMFGGGILGFAAFIIVFVIGHTLNIGVNLLGAYVHTNRLQFVEFFGKFYDGGGRAFKPFSPHTKYYKFKEE